jgi:hypothetical protein
VRGITKKRKGRVNLDLIFWVDYDSFRQEESSMTLSIKFYTKPKCSLCNDIRILLGQLRKETPLDIEEVNILDESDLYEKYKYEIPVLLFPDGSELKGRIDDKELKEKIFSKKL